jgi:hypothetical protein
VKTFSNHPSHTSQSLQQAGCCLTVVQRAVERVLSYPVQTFETTLAFSAYFVAAEHLPRLYRPKPFNVEHQSKISNLQEKLM